MADPDRPADSPRPPLQQGDDSASGSPTTSTDTSANTNTDTAADGRGRAEPAPDPTDDLVTTSHRFGDATYTASAGRVVLREEVITDGAFGGHRAKVEMFVVAYMLDGADPATRPVTFAFNGGPGSSSVWLHLGLLGPRRVVAGDVDDPAPPPYGLADNPESLLAHSDLVFIDPVSTGYTRTVTGGKPADYHGFTPDRDAVAELIRLWTTRNNRWLSPKFLVGESYGTLRAAALAGHLAERTGMALNGLILVSSVLDLGTVFFTPGDDDPYVHYLPTYAALAHYHGLLPDRTLQQAVADAQALADRDYRWALERGSRLTPDERAEMATRLADVTGLSVDYLLRADLRVEHQHFFAELLRHRGRMIGRLDGRFTGAPADLTAATIDDDASYWHIQAPYTAAANHYLRAELGYESDLPYEILTDRVQPWSYREFENRSVSVLDDLAKAMRANPFLKVHVAFGYYDGATPMAAAEHCLAHLRIPDARRADISRRYYPAGHMMYVHEPTRVAQSADLADFVRWATGGPNPDA
ncbi:S10 family peptidase [Nakamurella endophytica]|uniref:Peptidase S10 n=1 Tax=Nakamurella endophytica TaxID=1748367 RepID=A0A917WAY8_9ACTN|nr:peptidase S10 [Nakamurella endophytica]GGL87171.1 peptidase S10 [Nakamurella endophytica]